MNSSYPSSVLFQITYFDKRYQSASSGIFSYRLHCPPRFSSWIFYIFNFNQRSQNPSYFNALVESQHYERSHTQTNCDSERSRIVLLKSCLFSLPYHNWCVSWISWIWSHSLYIIYQTLLLVFSFIKFIIYHLSSSWLLSFIFWVSG